VPIVVCSDYSAPANFIDGLLCEWNLLRDMWN
jgi:hypothetical protein